MGKKFFIGVFTDSNALICGITEATQTTPREVSYKITNDLREVKEFDETELNFAEILIKILSDEYQILKIVWLPE